MLRFHKRLLSTHIWDKDGDMRSLARLRTEPATGAPGKRSPEARRWPGYRSEGHTLISVPGTL